ncbi:hypothetical protein [Azomonas macrocytogenes]|uniref:Uncharacterized protein n=1 Tax=Azomonas macrocytogenes TaxID=69962 RepID=A0A839TC96_AZOMA|nr:hypothetical protein [Azomonas macrocytogenes]MBB3105223.1 hypothetical protein [Azomonas macrocytogenes]
MTGRVRLPSVVGIPGIPAAFGADQQTDGQSYREIKQKVMGYGHADTPQGHA